MYSTGAVFPNHEISLMKFLANENFPFPSTRLLRDAGIEIKSISENFPGIADKTVIDIARKEESIILTFDKDYGEIIFRFGEQNPPSVIYFRYKGKNPEFAGEFILKLLHENKMQFENTFTVIEESNIRQRQY
ncbi:hypothetical protein BH11BAC7_BH11BAC7_28590 [soil metagenome]